MTKTFTIEITGNTLSDVVQGIEEAQRQIERGFWSGFDSNDTGSFSFGSDGRFDDEEED